MRFPKPSTLIGDNLEEELRAAGMSDVTVSLLPRSGEIEVVGKGLDEAAIRAAVEAHTGEPTTEQSQTIRDRENLRVPRALLQKARRILAGDTTVTVTQQESDKVWAATVVLMQGQEIPDDSQR